jgi:hypothetical protein
MEIGVYKVQSKAEPDKFLIIHGNDPEKVLENLLIPLNKGQYFGERLQDHFNKYGEDDLECFLLVPHINNFLSALAVRDMIEAEQPYFNGTDPITVLDEIIDEVPEVAAMKEVKTEKAIVKNKGGRKKK